MRQFALGRLGYDPGRFAKMIVGDFFDAMAGYNEAETERFKRDAGLIRRATALLWNIQVSKEYRKEENELWPFRWEVEDIRKADPAAYKEALDKSKKWMDKHF
jgi:hypothetical protein